MVKTYYHASTATSYAPILSIRLATLSDTPEISRLLAECFGYPPQFLPQIITDLSDHLSLPLPTYFSLVILLNGEISAVCEVIAQSNICYLMNLCVLPALRGFGVGSFLVAIVEAIALALDIKYVCLNVLTNNTAAQKLYNKLGYQNQGQMIIRNNPTYLMGKVL